MSVVSFAKNFFGIEESLSDELVTREAIPINSRQTFRPSIAQKNKRSQVSELNEIFTLDVTSYQGDAARIGVEYRDGKTVIVNLGEMNTTEARRVIDFMMGLTFALDGEARRVTEKVYLLAHAGVAIEGETAAEDSREADALYIRP